MADRRHGTVAMAHAHDHTKALEMMRSEKDHFLREHPHSPIPADLRAAFSGLAYFPPDPKYRFRVPLQKYPNPERVVLATSKGIPREMVRYGFFEFEVEGVKQRLDVYNSMPQPGHGHAHEDHSLFIPFRDATSGKETYGAARYIDLEEEPSSAYILDFNLAYNPYCAYSDDYVCPFPPRENWLTVPIRAGEQNFPLRH